MANFMSYQDALSVFGEYADVIKESVPIVLTYAQFMALTEEERNNGNFIVTGYPDTSQNNGGT